MTHFKNKALTYAMAGMTFLAGRDAMAQRSADVAREQALVIGLDPLDDKVGSAVHDTLAGHYARNPYLDKTYHWQMRGDDNRPYDIKADITRYNIMLVAGTMDSSGYQTNLYTFDDVKPDVVTELSVHENRILDDGSKFSHFQRYKAMPGQDSLTLDEESVVSRKGDQQIVEASAKLQPSGEMYTVVKQQEESAFGNRYKKLSEISKFGFAIADMELDQIKPLTPIPACKEWPCYEAFQETIQKTTHPEAFKHISRMMASFKHFFK